MIKWLAFIMAWFALVLGASSRDINKVTARLEAIESRQCLLMSVSTPVRRSDHLREAAMTLPAEKTLEREKEKQ